MSQVLLDGAGRRRSPATLPGFHAGRPPRNKGRRYPPDPPTIEEIVAVMHHAGDGTRGRRLRGLIVVLWRAGLRIHEALALGEADLDRRRWLLVRRGKGGRRGDVGMDEWAWSFSHGLTSAPSLRSIGAPSSRPRRPRCPERPSIANLPQPYSTGQYQPSRPGARQRLHGRDVQRR